MRPRLRPARADTHEEHSHAAFNDANLRASGEWEEEERYGKIFLKKDAVEVNPRLDWESYSTTAEEAIASATIIDGVPFINLNELVTFKRALGRGKDLPDIVIIEEYLAGRVGNP